MIFLHPSLLLVLLVLFAPCDAWGERLEIDLASGLADSILARDPGARNGRCVVADVSKLSGTAFDAGTPPLRPGCYRVQFRIKLPRINDENTAPLQWHLGVGGAGRGDRPFDILLIEQAGVFQDIPCNFVVPERGQATLTLSWKRVALRPDRRADVRVEKKDLPTVKEMAGTGEAAEGLTDDDIDVELSEEPPLAALKYLYMAIEQVSVTRASDVSIETLSVDKIRYLPGESPAVSVGVRNADVQGRTLRLETIFVHDLDTVIPVDERTLDLAAGAGASFTCQGPPVEKKWGYEVRCRATEGDRQLAERSEFFTVHDNLWAVLITGRGPSQFTAHVTRERAIQSAASNKARYQNFVESGFWAPDEFGDFTPDTESWWGGQGCYYGSVQGTKMQIEEGHKAGIAFAVYSNIWGGDGPPAFEMIRRRPDLGYASAFNVGWFDRWDRNPMGTDKKRFPMHVWPLTIIRHGAGGEAIRHHARELIATHRMFGWDAVRYDSHSISNESAALVKVVKEVVRAEIPSFQFGYNSSVPHRVPDLIDAFREHCEGGGGIMEEGIRQFGGGGMSFTGGATYEVFARRILEFKNEARESGGHFLAIGMDKCFPNDLVYQYIFWLAGNTHPCYDWLEASVANYAQFATRFAGLLWDLNVIPVKSPEKWLEVGESESFLWLWKDYVHQRDMGGGRRQLIVHLIQKPAEAVLYTHDDNKTPPLREHLRLSLRLPAGSAVRNVWFLTAEYSLTQRSIPYESPGEGRIAFTVPRLRFWSTVVVDLAGAGPFE
ncbi:MAG: hypothetical protein HYU36_08985 [Planctomycetes bacterium]|nr:hypothetical protein [Planctomycetota bacterium]